MLYASVNRTVKYESVISMRYQMLEQACNNWIVHEQGVVFEECILCELYLQIEMHITSYNYYFNK